MLFVQWEVPLHNTPVVESFSIPFHPFFYSEQQYTEYRHPQNEE